MELTFNLHFQSEFVGGIRIVTTNPINYLPDLIEKFKIDQKRSKKIDKVDIY